MYNDDVVSEKYHNNGQLKAATYLVLSIMSNIFSSTTRYFLEKLSNYSDSLEAILKESYMKKYYSIGNLKSTIYFKFS